MSSIFGFRALGEKEIWKIYLYWDQLMTMKLGSVDLSISCYVSSKNIEVSEQPFRLGFPLFKTAKLWNYTIQQAGEKNLVKALCKVARAGIEIKEREEDEKTDVL